MEDPKTREALVLETFARVRMTEDDLFWYLGIGRYGQCELECDILPRTIREFYKRVYSSSPAEPKTS